MFYCMGFVCEYFSFLIHLVISIVAAIVPFYYAIAASSKLSLHQPSIFASSSPLQPPVEGVRVGKKRTRGGTEWLHGFGESWEN